MNLPDISPKIRYFGLSIGRISLRAVELDATGKPRTSAEVFFPIDVFSGGVLQKKDQFVAALNKIRSIGQFSTPFVNVCIPESYAYTRGHTVPKIPLDEVGEAVSWHVKDLFPFPESEIYIDWRLLETRETEYQIAVVAIQKKVLDGIIVALNEAGLKPMRFEPGASAITRLLGLKSGEKALVTEINRTGAYVTLVSGEKTIFTTIVNYAQQDKVENYVKNINQTIHEIATYYQDKGILTGTKVDVVLSGELASDEWSRAVAYPNKILKTPMHNPAFNKAYAAAISQVTPPHDPQSINLLPEHLQKAYDAEQAFLFQQTLTLRSAIALAGILIISLIVFISLRIKRQDLETKVASLTEQSKSQSQETQKLLLLNEKSKTIVALSPLRKTPREVLVELVTLIPDQIVITQIEYDDSKLQYALSGVAPTRDALIDFKGKLEASDRFAKVTLPLGSLEAPENVRFTMTFLLRK